jgi:hypothetical protein
MSEIRRAANGSEESPSFEEFQSLKNQVAELTSKVNYLSRVVGALTYVDWSSRVGPEPGVSSTDGEERPLKMNRYGERSVESMEDIVDTLMQLEGCDYIPSRSDNSPDPQHQQILLPHQNGPFRGYDVRGAPYSHQFLKRFNYTLSSSSPASSLAKIKSPSKEAGGRPVAKILQGQSHTAKGKMVTPLGFSMKAVSDASARYASEKLTNWSQQDDKDKGGSSCS